MATEKLVRAVISGPTEKAEDAIRALVLGREFHALPAAAAIKGVEGLTPLAEADPYKDSLLLSVKLLEDFRLEPRYSAFADMGYTPESAEAYVKGVFKEQEELKAERESCEKLKVENAALVESLRPFGELGVDVGELLDVRYLDVRFGFVPAEVHEDLRALADSSGDISLFRTGADSKHIYYICLALPENTVRVSEELAALGFETLDKPQLSHVHGIPVEQIKALETAAAEAKDRSMAILRELAALKGREWQKLLTAYSYLRFMSAGAEKRGICAEKDGKFYLVGWLPENKQEAFRADAEALGLEFEQEKPGLGELSKVPVKFTDGFFARIFAPFVEMYGYPDYGEADPRLFMTFTYCLLFGIMFGDIGQGAVLVFLGLVLTKKGMWLGRIISAVGCAAVVMGFVYGSVFGNEHLLPGFKVLEEGNLTNILLVSAAVGVLLIVACGVMNIITGLKQHDPKKAFFSANGVCGVVFLVSLVVGAVCTLLLKVNLLGNLAYLIPLIILPVLLIWAGEPLAWLMEGKKGPAPTVGMVILEGFFDLFESCLSWFSNILSFLRVGTYTICHAIMMMVVYTLSAGDNGGYSIFGLIFGNIIVMVIEAVLVCIQVLRLEFYELFGRFYSGRGTPFKSNAVDYTEAGVTAA